MDIYNFTDYRELLNKLLTERLGRGSKAQLAKVLGCQPGYISQVLNKDNKIHFSPENLMKISAFIKLDSAERDYLLLLLNKERAGTQDLKDHYEEKLRNLQGEYLTFEKKMKKRTSDLDDKSKGVYYSHWAYCSVHMVISIPEYNTLEKIAAKLGLEESFADEVLSFLEERGLITKKNNKYSIGETRIHLDNKSPHIRAHHQNFRIKAIMSLEKKKDFDLHYSSVMTLSKKDILKIRELVLNLVASKDGVLIPSPNEDMVCLNIDLIKF